jgi:hypothetical protein
LAQRGDAAAWYLPLAVSEFGSLSARFQIRSVENHVRRMRGGIAIVNEMEFLNVKANGEIISTISSLRDETVFAQSKNVRRSKFEAMLIFRAGSRWETDNHYRNLKTGTIIARVKWRFFTDDSVHGIMP